MCGGYSSLGSCVGVDNQSPRIAVCKPCQRLVCTQKFARYRATAWWVASARRPSNGAILDAVKFMESHVADPVSLSDLACSAGVSERQLNCLFLKNLGGQRWVIIVTCALIRRIIY